MPKREDEFWAGRKEEKEGVPRRPLCPFCGKGDRVYYNKQYKCWRCGWCEKSFPTPSGVRPVKGEFVEEQAPQLYRCPRCGRDSLFKHHKSGLYECLNRDCQAVFASTYIVEPARKSGKPSHTGIQGEVRGERGTKGFRCPRCGSSSIYYSRYHNRWYCPSCNLRTEDLRSSQVKDEFAEHHERMQQVKASRRARRAPSGTYRTTPTAVGYRKRRKLSWSWLKKSIKGGWRRWSKPRYKPKVWVSIATVLGVSLISLALLAFGFVRIATWVNWLSLPWIEGWGELFIGFLPFEIIIVILGILGVGWVLTQRMGAMVLMSVLLVSGLVVVTATDIPEILFWRGENGERMEELIEPDIFSVIVGADGHRIWLHNNPDARNPTWEELLAFLQNDRTDQHPYDPDSFVCADYAEMLHNNAEKAGVRAAYVCTSDHALNAFNVVDRGLVFVDSTHGDSPVDATEISGFDIQW